MTKRQNPAVAEMWKDASNSRLEAEVEDLKRQLEELRTSASASAGVTLYPIEKFTPLRLVDGLSQPRKYFDPEGMEKLRVSITKVGVQEPLLVRRAQDGKLEIVSGERRWRCGVDLKLEALPAIEKVLTDEEALEIALIANLTRENLNVIEETDSIIALLGLKLKIARDKLPSFLIKIRNLRLRYEKSDEDIAIEIENGDSDFSGKINANSISSVDVILNEFGIGLVGFVTNRLNSIQKMPEKLLDAVREGRVDFSKADVIRKAPEGEQEALLRQAEEGVTKADLVEKVKTLKSSSGEGEPSGGMRERIHRSYSQIRRKANWEKIEADSKLKKKLQRIESLLEELSESLEK